MSREKWLVESKYLSILFLFFKNDDVENDDRVQRGSMDPKLVNVDVFKIEELAVENVEIILGSMHLKMVGGSSDLSFSSISTSASTSTSTDGKNFFFEKTDIVRAGVAPAGNAYAPYQSQGLAGWVIAEMPIPGGACSHGGGGPGGVGGACDAAQLSSLHC